MGPLSKASWAVAASVAAVEALKDQAGLCRWNYALRALQQRAKARARSSLAPDARSSGRARFAPGAAPAVKGSGLDEMAARRRRRKAEKDEAVHHLVCWGPN